MTNLTNRLQRIADANLGLTVWPELLNSSPRFWQEKSLSPSDFFEDSSATKMPAMDFSETKNKKSYEIETEVPGFDIDDITVEFEGNALYIKGETNKTKEENDKKKDYYLRERQYQSIFRKIELPLDAQVEKAECTIKNGVLKITIPKKSSQTLESKKLKIRSES